jgi:hypothetical protein
MHSLYQKGTSTIVMGHSMAGIVVDISPPTYKHFCRHHHVDACGEDAMQILDHFA